MNVLRKAIRYLDAKPVWRVFMYIWIAMAVMFVAALGFRAGLGLIARLLAVNLGLWVLLTVLDNGWRKLARWARA